MKLLPPGATEDPANVVEYNLHGKDHSSFLVTNFNHAMAGWLECVQELGTHAQEQDKSLRLPFAIEGDKIAGVSIKMQGNDKTWTTALKYALTDLKWLLTWSTRHPPARTASGALWAEEQHGQTQRSARSSVV